MKDVLLFGVLFCLLGVLLISWHPNEKIEMRLHKYAQKLLDVLFDIVGSCVVIFGVLIWIVAQQSLNLINWIWTGNYSGTFVKDVVFLFLMTLETFELIVSKIVGFYF